MKSIIFLVVRLRHNGGSGKRQVTSIPATFVLQGGKAMQSMPVQPPIFFKNPTVATLLSFLITGLGQFYNGQIIKGILFLGMMWISLMLIWAFGLGFVTTPIVWVLGLVDANRSAKKINQRLAAGAAPVQLE